MRPCDRSPLAPAGDAEDACDVGELVGAAVCRAAVEPPEQPATNSIAARHAANRRTGYLTIRVAGACQGPVVRGVLIIWYARLRPRKHAHTCSHHRERGTDRNRARARCAQ